MSLGRKEQKAATLCIGLIAVGIFAVGGFFTFFETVEYDEIGLAKNNFTGELDYSITYLPGRYLVGPFIDIIRFPSIVKTIAFNPGDSATDDMISARTKNGLSISFDISYQYKLNKSEIGDLVKDYGLDYEDTYTKTSRDVFREECGLWTALEFYTNLTDIGDALENALITAFSDLHAEIYGVQLTNIDLPDSFEKAREDAEVAKMQEEIEQYNQNAALIRIQTELLEAEASANVSRIEALIAAEIVEIQAIAQSNATDIGSAALTNRAMIMMNATFWNDTNSNDVVDAGEMENIFTSDQITEYLIIALIADSETADFYVGIDPTYWTNIE
ncbi:MAG: hypothetical protein GY870_08330 [archaeon]|nr:hypothetical protein [archaeon]